MTRPVINPGTLVWTGEHFINYLREPGSAVDTGMVSLYHTRYCVAGEGTVALVQIGGDDGFSAVCTDDPDVAEFVLATFVRGRGNPFDRDLPVVQAEIARSGDIRTAPTWEIRTGDRHVTAEWSQIRPPVISAGWAPTFAADADYFTLLFFCEAASITLDGRAVPGRPYRRDNWRKSIGGDRSSCVFALGEAMIRVHEDGRDEGT